MGAPRLIALVMTIALAMLPGAPAHAQDGGEFRVDEHGAQILRALFIEDAIGYVKGSSAYLSYAPLPRREIVVTAPALLREYAFNELAAEKRYAGRGIALSGVVLSVARDATGRPYIEFASSGMSFGNVQAYLLDSAVSTASFYIRGQTLELVCGGVRKGFMVPEAFNCASEDQLLRDARVVAADIVNDFLKAQPSKGLTPQNRKQMFALYWVVTHIHEVGKCFDTNPSAIGTCAPLMNSALKGLRNNQRFRDDYAAAAPSLDLTAPLLPRTTQ